MASASDPEIDLVSQTDAEFEADLTEKVKKVREKRRANGSTRQTDSLEKDLLRAKRKAKQAHQAAEASISSVCKRMSKALEAFMISQAKKENS